MKEQVLTLGINVLSYDFIGTCPDNASSEALKPHPHSRSVHCAVPPSVAPMLRSLPLPAAVWQCLPTAFTVRGAMPSGESRRRLAPPGRVILSNWCGDLARDGSWQVGTIQVPTAWRTVVQSPATMQLLFDVYSVNEAPRSAQVLELLM